MRPPAIAMACWAVWTYLPEKVLLLTKYTPTELFARFRRLNAMLLISAGPCTARASRSGTRRKKPGETCWPCWVRRRIGPLCQFHETLTVAK